MLDHTLYKFFVLQHFIAADGSQSDQIPAVTRLYLAQGSRDDLSRLVYQENVIAEPLGGLHQMRREDYRFILRLELGHYVDQKLNVYRIKPGKRFVQYQQVWV